VRAGVADVAGVGRFGVVVAPVLLLGNEDVLAVGAAGVGFAVVGVLVIGLLGADTVRFGVGFAAG
jgi:hypothetical protein